VVHLVRQDLSIAGKRAGLAGARSGLYMEQIRIIKEMRERDRRMGRTGEFVRPRYMVWENVPGAFSSNGGKDFAAVLEEAIRVAEPEAPDIEVPEKGWNTWGGYHDEMGGRWSVAWRVLDAQHWGVPQRRRRIALVADFGGDTAWEILFERQSMSGYPAESGAAGESLAASAESGAAYAVRIRGGCDGGGKGALVQTEKSGTIKAGNDQTLFCPQGNAIDRADTAGCNGKGWREDVSYTLNTIDRPAVCAGANCLTPWDSQSKRVYSEAGVMPTLQAGENSGQNQEAVLCAGFKLGNSEQARSIGYAEEQAPTLNAECGGNKPAVLCLNDQGGSMMGVSHDVSGTLRAQEHGHQPSILDMSHACDVIRDCGEVAPSLQARMGTGGNQIPLTYQKTTGTLSPGAHAGSYNGQDAYNNMLVVSSEIHPALRAKANDPYRTDMAAYVASVDCRNFREGGEINGTLQAKESGGQSLNLNNTIRQNMVVRRLTPLECERLQGFPDHWTDLGEWTDSKGKRHKDADSPRYKALGNSIALPPWKWLLKRLCGNYERDATMASLFDGIGGFPLIWEQLNGRGTCLWASEIEEFPIAVTKRRFGTLEEPGDMGRFLFPCGNERSGT
jgi:DNA (cytosine-5)-methyltransferase 1